MGVLNMSGWLGQSLNCGGFDDRAANDPWARFAAEIVIHAVDDWRTLIKCGAWLEDGTRRSYGYGTISFDELRGFFNSPWCEFLMQDFGISPAAVLKVLEAELQEAMQKPVQKRRKGRKY